MALAVPSLTTLVGPIFIIFTGVGSSTTPPPVVRMDLDRTLPFFLFLSPPCPVLRTSRVFSSLLLSICRLSDVLRVLDISIPRHMPTPPYSALLPVFLLHHALALLTLLHLFPRSCIYGSERMDAYISPVPTVWYLGTKH